MKKIAVITPYYKEPLEVLQKCHESVLSQKIPATHFFIADGFPKIELAQWNIKHISLAQGHDDNGDTPRGIGGILAEIEGYDYVAYLDADNWFHPDHLSSLMEEMEKTGADITCSFRTMHALDGSELEGVQDSDELSLEHVDTSCYLIHRNAFEALHVWLRIPKKLSPICDRIYYLYLKHKNFKLAYTKNKSSAFRSQYRVHYEMAKVIPPGNLKDTVGGGEAFQWLLTIEGLKETVNKLGFIPV
jgi:glycosyltransferase involved in cell wall biosynthesis